jgi:hypothetical protein
VNLSAAASINIDDVTETKRTGWATVLVFYQSSRTNRRNHFECSRIKNPTIRAMFKLAGNILPSDGQRSLCRALSPDLNLALSQSKPTPGAREREEFSSTQEKSARNKP